MTLVELLPFINLLLGVAVIPLIKTLFAINKSLDEISTTVKLLEQDVNSKVKDLAKEVERINSKLAKHDEHIFHCNSVLSKVNKGE